MLVRFAIIISIILTSCQSGRIPCPEVKTTKLHRNKINPAKSTPFYISKQQAEKESTTRVNVTRESQTEKWVLKHESVEEWDCPKPGQKHVPKSVKDNIKKNMKKVKNHYKKRVELDSLGAVYIQK